MKIGPLRIATKNEDGLTDRLTDKHSGPLQRAILLQFLLAWKNKMRLGLHVKCPIFSAPF
jgi:hypothetical protein